VDLPTFGSPTIATIGNEFFIFYEIGFNWRAN
jgi:hypothetical protein